jgi:hypothetical protein
VLDFNNYFLNLKRNKIYDLDNQGFKSYVGVETSTPALASAIAFSKNENYFSLFDYYQPYFHMANTIPCKTPYDLNSPEGICKEPLPSETSQTEIMATRRKWSDLAASAFLEGIQQLKSLPDDSTHLQVCKVTEEALYKFHYFQFLLGLNISAQPHTFFLTK